MKVAIINKKERIIVVGGMNLLPGANYEEEFMVKKHIKMLEDKIESGCLEIPEMDVEDDLAASLLGGYNAADAIKLIKETNDYDVLMKFQIEETSDKARKTVLQAIEDQIKLNKEALDGNE